MMTPDHDLEFTGFMLLSDCRAGKLVEQRSIAAKGIDRLAILRIKYKSKRLPRTSNESGSAQVYIPQASVKLEIELVQRSNRCSRLQEAVWQNYRVSTLAVEY